MATINQLVKGARKVKSYKSNVPALQNSPQKEVYALVSTPLHQRNQILQ